MIPPIKWDKISVFGVFLWLWGCFVTKCIGKSLLFGGEWDEKCYPFCGVDGKKYYLKTRCVEKYGYLCISKNRMYLWLTII